ncbi:ArsR family transcriptional regulator [Mesorhizobium sp. M0618]|uniref:ArsR family transcriptional regulator n=1 Tax=unclassified Mesorhizobium TaxID=325217 RepID=UPI00333B4197
MVSGKHRESEKPSIMSRPPICSRPANEKRLLALMILAEGETSVSDLAPRLGLSNSALSQQLGIMPTGSATAGSFS